MAEIKIDETLKEQLDFYSTLLKKNPEVMIQEALEQYFVNEEKKLADQDPLTNLSYDEFWDGVDL